MTKNEILAQTLLQKVKQRNETGVVDNFYMVGVLTVYGIYLPKIIAKKLLASFFVDTVYWRL